MRPLIFFAAAYCLSCTDLNQGAQPWPAEAWSSATVLTHLDPAFENNMSGACYNPVTRRFWICCNGDPSAFWSLCLGGDGEWMIAEENGKQARYDLGKGDLEGICQADYSKDLVYLMVEGKDRIREYDTSVYGHAELRSEWDISAYVPTDSGTGSEGITFVPDEWLEKGGFTDAAGNPYLSQNGMGGLMFVAHQNGGRIYAFDLDAKEETVSFVGSYTTSRKESSGLEFDRSTGLLYIWHNTGPNYLEVTELASLAQAGERRMSTVAEFVGPKEGNLEGIALSPAAQAQRLCLMVDDDNQDGAALILFEQFDSFITRRNGPGSGN